MPNLTLEEFDTLYQAISSALRRIAHQTNGEYELDDMRGEAWEKANKMLESGKYDSISSPEFEKGIVAHLYNHLVKWANNIVRNALRTEYGNQDEDRDRYNWLDAALASAENDPVAQLIAREEMQEREQALKKRLESSYSEVVAYFRLLENLNSDKETIAEHLGLSWNWIWYKIKRATDWEKEQDSLFNQTEIIDKNFVPPPSRFKRRKLLTRSERRSLEHQKRLQQRKLFPRLYIPIRVILMEPICTI